MSPRLCLLLLVAVSWSGVAWAQSSQYCRFSSRHTLCLHTGLGETCGNQVQARGVSAQDANLILAMHNQLRSRVAMGREALGAPGPQPQAANMRLMEWDDELAIVAQSHADQCIFEHECSDCRRVSRFGVGQNLFISFQSNFNTRIQWSRAIRAWYDEVAEFDPAAIQPFQFSTPVGHYTQMMWWNTYKVGCGYTMFREGGWWKKLYTCNYGPGGNIIFSEMYRRGSPCSSCPAGTSCSLEYPGLCEDNNAYDSTKLLPANGTENSVAITGTSPDVNAENNEVENEIPLIPLTPENTDIDTINSFNSFNGINSINPNDVDIAALVEFFNIMRESGNRMPSVSVLNNIFKERKPGLVSARVIASTSTPNELTTEPPISPATTSTTSPSTTPSTTTTTTSTIPSTLSTTTTTTSTSTTTTPTPTTTASTTTSSSSEGPTTFSNVPSNQVLQRTGTVPSFRTRAPAVAQAPALAPAAFAPAPAVFPAFHAQQEEEAFEHEFEAEAQEAEFEHEAQEQEQEHEQEEQMFIPFHGNQPRTTDLMPFLQRAGVNTQVIRTSTLSSVQSIINSLPLGLKPIVLFRSGTGQLTELDAGTLLPLRRFGRSTTTTRGPKKAPGVMMTCDLDVSPCEYTPVGANWTIGDSPSEGRYAQATLEEGEGAQLMFQKLVSAPSTESVCIAVSHRRELEEGAHPNATIPELMVGVLPIGGEVMRESLGGAPGLWEISRVSISNVKTSFLVVMTIAPASDKATVAVDALQITDGRCCLSGVC